jgi:hypothetical protein
MSAVLRRWWLWAGAAFMVGAVFVGFLLIPISEPLITQTNCDKIRLGMSPFEVIEILGEHPLPTWVRRGGDVGELYLAWWDDDANCIEVRFTGKQGVTSKSFKPSELSTYQRLKSRLERRIEAMWP